MHGWRAGMSMRSRLGRALIACGVLLLAMSAGQARAQGDPASGWPKQPIRILVGFAAGGAAWARRWFGPT